MSGIVGSTGSRSGVIGETELDYEKGTWTPYFQVSGSNISASYAEQVGGYIKIGKLVHVNLTMTLSAESISSGAMQVSLPFTQTSAFPAVVNVGRNTGFSDADSPQAGYCGSGASVMNLLRGTSDGRSMLQHAVGGDVLSSSSSVFIDITLTID
tara:strand:- start:212 stop:673 length:462 start_codon:yes stop_codon:yes gene_type:complete